jgi:hypothetical protein
VSAGTQPRRILLGANGRHISLGRTEPSEAAVSSANDLLAVQTLSRRLARMQGEYYSRGKVTLEPLQRIGAAQEPEWKTALSAFLAARCRATH